MTEAADLVPPDLIPSSGRILGGVHEFPVRVYYEDTDAAGLVYHAQYLAFVERARTEMMRLIGIDHTALKAEHGVAFVVRSAELDFRRAARLDDRLVVETRILEQSGAALLIEQRVRRIDPVGRTDLVAARLRLALIDQRLKPARLPAALRQAIAAVAPQSLREEF